MVHKDGMQNAMVMNDEQSWPRCYRMVHQLSSDDDGGGGGGVQCLHHKTHCLYYLHTH